MEICYVGSYTTAKRGGLQRGGISVFARDGGEAAWREIQVIEMMNPSFLAFGREKQNLYAVRADGNVVTAFAIDGDTGALRHLNEKRIGFDNGVSLTTDRESRFLFVASCSNGPGGVVSIRLNGDGSLGEICDIVIRKGETGPLRPAQIGTRPHQVCLDAQGKYLVVPDKALDEVNSFAVEASGRLTHISTTKFPMGCCPRHVAFHPSRPLAYLLAEWTGRIVACRYEEGVFTPMEIVGTTPTSYVGLKNLGAEIQVHPCGEYLYASNRGHNSLAACRILEDGRLEPIGWYCEGVAKPRYFTLSEDGKWLYCANEEGHSVSLFSVDEETGGLKFAGTAMHAGAPACVLFKTMQQEQEKETK